MRVFGLWHGGASYSYGELTTDGEAWPSLADAKRSLIERLESGYWHTDASVRVLNFDDDGTATIGGSSGALRPVVTRDCYIDLYWAERVPGSRTRWTVSDEPYARLSVGPRGGVVVQNH